MSSGVAILTRRFFPGGTGAGRLHGGVEAAFLQFLRYQSPFGHGSAVLFPFKMLFSTLDSLCISSPPFLVHIHLIIITFFLFLLSSLAACLLASRPGALDGPLHNEHASSGRFGEQEWCSFFFFRPLFPVLAPRETRGRSGVCGLTTVRAWEDAGKRDGEGKWEAVF